MNSRNTIQLIGNLGTNPAYVKSQGNQNMIFFPVATHDTFVNAKGEKLQDTQWHNVVAVGKLAQRIMTFVEKGDEILVKGKMTYNQKALSTLNLDKGAIFLKEIIFLGKTGTSNKIKEKDVELAQTA